MNGFRVEKTPDSATLTRIIAAIFCASLHSQNPRESLT